MTTPQLDTAKITKALSECDSEIDETLSAYLSVTSYSNVLNIKATPVVDSEEQENDAVRFCAVVAALTLDQVDDGPLDVLVTDGEDKVVLDFTDLTDDCNRLELTRDELLQAAAQLIAAAVLGTR
ncbi:hypothetical protein [Nonomuraea glycinis]|uniref:hypothetical protein n=1 Tax=Nonomuraea glycinis TaxID=2047744 RepID=UPI0033A23B8F